MAARTDVPPDPDRGVDLVAGDDGRVSSSAVAQAVVSAALRAADPDAAERAAAVRTWRQEYLTPYRDLVVAGARDSTAAYAVADTGIATLRERSVFVRDDALTPLDDALELPPREGFRDLTISGEGERATEFTLPYNGSRLGGAELRHLADRWQADGIVEPGLTGAVHDLLAHPGWLDLRDTTVVVLGAGAEMGPLRSLLRWGATVIAVDLPRAELWNRVIDGAVTGAGRLVMPVPVRAKDDGDPALVAGADLLRDLPEVHAWLAGRDGPYTLGSYLYADGVTHIRVSLAADALATALTARRDDVGLAYLATPTDVYAAPEAAVRESERRWSSRGLAGLVQAPLRLAGRFEPNYPSTLTRADGTVVGLADCLVLQQGPSYALAKRLQRWRATVARRDGVWCSLAIAPATRTRSVVKNRALAAAYAGAHRFGIEVFDPSTSNTLMAGLLVHHLRSGSSPARPDSPVPHPDDAWAAQAAHGGLWRVAYAPRSVLGIAAALGLLTRP